MNFETKQSPCFSQTEDEIEVYYRAEPEGAVAVMRATFGGMLTYTVSTFDSRRTKSGRINVVGQGDFYMKSGRNCFEPKGQKRLVIPTQDVLQWAKDNPCGDMGYICSFW